MTSNIEKHNAYKHKHRLSALQCQRSDTTESREFYFLLASKYFHLVWDGGVHNDLP